MGEITEVPAETGHISGHVTVYGAPVPGAAIMADGEVVASTNPAGGYLIELPIGEHLISVVAPGYKDPAPRTITVRYEKYEDGNFTLAPLMTGATQIKGVLASGPYPYWGGYIYPIAYPIELGLGKWGALEVQVSIQSGFWKLDPPEIVYPNGRVDVAQRIMSGPTWEQWKTPILDQAGTYHVRLKLQSSQDNVNWAVSDERYIVFCTVEA